MTVWISSEVLATVMREALDDATREVCGLLFGDANSISACQPCRNAAADPGRAFEMEPRTLIDAHRRSRDQGPAVVGHYHSHPSGRAEPSATDAAAAASGQLWLIAADGDIRLWRAVEEPVAYESVQLAPPPGVGQSGVHEMGRTE